MQQRGEVGAKRTHFRRRQVIALDAERLRVRGERLHREFKIIGVGDFVVGVHEDDEFAGGMLESEAFAFLHVFAVVVEDNRAVFFCDVAGAVGGVRIGEDDFMAVARITLPRDGRETVVEQRLNVQRRHDDADARQMFRTGRHRAIVGERGIKFKSALHELAI